MLREHAYEKVKHAVIDMGLSSGHVYQAIRTERHTLRLRLNRNTDHELAAGYLDALAQLAPEPA